MEKYTVIRKSANWTPDKAIGTFKTIWEALAKLPKGYKAYMAYENDRIDARVIYLRKTGIKTEYCIKAYH